MMSVLQSRDKHLKIRHVSHHYEKKLALQNVSLDVAKSEILALLRPSGSGKSTLLAAIAGMVPPIARNLARRSESPRALFVIAFISLTSTGYLAAAQSVTLYTAGPDGLARGIAKSFTEKAASKSTPNRATSGDVLARLDRHGYGHDRRRQALICITVARRLVARNP